MDRSTGPTAKVIRTLQPMAKAQGHYSLLTALFRPGCVRTVWLMHTHQLRYACHPCLTSVHADSFWCVRTYAGGCVRPLLQCVRMGDSFGLQDFLHDLFFPRALFSNFRSDPSILKPETLEQTNQAIEQNGKRVNTYQKFG
ncbi:hypothetical protein PIB30_034669 [Stylosanthes scabra]|uniref:Uncharacterized protein n=1 Tax=Stylosanthes scabra TaxID=79078 RepID=A0ABU6RDF2_9FABA|nr:hypothetical protein [Stylosanthes scabra]